MPSARLIAPCAALAVAAATIPAFAGSHPAATASQYSVGAAVESINPDASMLANHDFYLGGYGLSSGKPLNNNAAPAVVPGRYATGIMDGIPGFEPGVHTRALVISDGRHAIAFAQVELQGYFLAYKQGPFGLEEIRKDAAAAIENFRKSSNGKPAGPSIDAGAILADSNHSHGGPDAVGAWGGVPTSYLKLVHDRTVEAILTAYENLTPATVTYGVAHAGVAGESQYQPSVGATPLLTNQFSDDPNNQVVDDEVRVLQAKSVATGNVIATYVNYSSHPTVLGSSNRLVTPDYTGFVSDLLTKEFPGSVGFDQVATLGRTQPNDGAFCSSGDDSVTCLEKYATGVVNEVQYALDHSSPVSGPTKVDMHSYLMNDVATNPALVGLVYGGQVVGAPIARAINPPWFTGPYLGTVSFTGRIGNILINGGPGEVYPQIFQTVRDGVPGLQGYINVGTAGDFLGYILPADAAYVQPIVHSVYPTPIDNDNYLFNISHSLGERLTCSLLRGAGDVFAGSATKYWSQRSLCALFADDLQKPADFDTTFPEQPDLSGVLTHQ